MNNLSPALYVPPLDENFNADSVPEDGLQYLQHVIYERQHCPEVVTKQIPHNKPSTDLPNTDERSQIDTAANILRPTKEWLRIQSQAFDDLQQKIIENRLISSTNKLEVLDLPESDDVTSWFQYCQSNPPLLSTMHNIDQRSLEALIDYQSEWLTDEADEPLLLGVNQKDSWLGRWIYASLACLQLPLEPSMHSVLRKITRSCYMIRSKLLATDLVNAVPLNLLICVISRNFNQSDLQHRSIVSSD